MRSWLMLAVNSFGSVVMKAKTSCSTGDLYQSFKGGGQSAQRDFVGIHLERIESMGPERVDKSHVGRVTSTRHDDATDARHVVASIERLQRFSRNTSNQALKSMGAGSGGTPMSPRTATVTAERSPLQ